MSRTTVLTKQQIIQCAYDIARDTGRKAITIREIGKRLGKSTAPIYTQYPSVEAIFTDLIIFIKKQIINSTQIKRTINSFLNIGVGFIAYVLENKLIFNDFFLSMDDSLLNIGGEEHSHLDQMKQNPFISVLTDEQLINISNDMRIYTYGLATMICIGSDGNHELDFYQRKLEETGNSLMKYYLYSSGKYELVMEKILKKFSKHIDIEEVFKQ
ncbi:MAG: TetR/AcrR family transcriptional regulator [Tenericutes bacterium]|nr:TetR/AcrR family transcriptional regulator [Mycoplasmatota bacterium]